MEQFDPTAPYEARRDFYRQLTKDPEFLALKPEDRQDVTRKILFSDEEKPSIVGQVVKGIKNIPRTAIELAKTAKDVIIPPPVAVRPTETLEEAKARRSGIVLRGALRGTTLGLINPEEEQQLLPEEERLSGAAGFVGGAVPFGTATTAGARLAQTLGAGRAIGRIAGAGGASAVQAPPGERVEQAVTGAGLMTLGEVGHGLVRAGRNYRPRVSYTDLGTEDIPPEPPIRLRGPEPVIRPAASPVEPVTPVPEGPPPLRPGPISPVPTPTDVFETATAERALLRTPEGRLQLMQQRLQARPVPEPEAIKPKQAVPRAKRQGRKTTIQAPVTPPVMVQPEPPAALPDPIQERLETLGIEVPSAETQPPEGQASTVQAPTAPETYQGLELPENVREGLTTPGTKDIVIEPASLTAKEVVTKIEDQQAPEHFDKPKITKEVEKGGETYVKTEVDPEALKVPGEKTVEPGISAPDKGPIVVDDKGKVIDGRHRVVDAKEAGETTIEAYVPAKMPTSLEELDAAVKVRKFKRGDIELDWLKEGKQPAKDALLSDHFAIHKPPKEPNAKTWVVSHRGTGKRLTDVRNLIAAKRIVEQLETAPGVKWDFTEQKGMTRETGIIGAQIVSTKGEYYLPIETPAPTKPELPSTEVEGWSTARPTDTRKMNLGFMPPGSSKPQPGQLAAIPTERGWVASYEDAKGVKHYSDMAYPKSDDAFNAAAGLAQRTKGPLRDIHQNPLKPGTAEYDKRLKEHGVTPEAETQAKQPWEMTQEEWNAGTRFYRSGGTKNAQTPTGERIILVQEATENNFREVSGDFFRRVRHNAIAKALHEGKSVPPEVLADYPDLQAKALTSSRGAVLPNRPADVSARPPMQPEQPYQQPPGQREVKKGDWVKYADRYGTVHEGRVDEIFTATGIVPSRTGGIQKGATRTTYSIVDANGKTLMPPVEGVAPQIIDEPADISMTKLAEPGERKVIPYQRSTLFTETANWLADTTKQPEKITLDEIELGREYLKDINKVLAETQIGKDADNWSKLQKKVVERIEAAEKGQPTLPPETSLTQPTYSRRDAAKAEQYVSRLMNDKKREYAKAYLDWIKAGRLAKDEPSWGDLSYMASQAVRGELNGMLPEMPETDAEEAARLGLGQEAKPPVTTGSFMAEFTTDDSGKWTANALRFATEEEANAYASDLFSRWMGAKDMRVVPSDDPVSHQWTKDGLEQIEEVAPPAVEDPIQKRLEALGIEPEEIRGPITNKDLAASGVTESNYVEVLRKPPSQVTEAQYIAAKQIQYHKERGELVSIETARGWYESFASLSDAEWKQRDQRFEAVRAATPASGGVAFATGIDIPPESGQITTRLPDPIEDRLKDLGIETEEADVPGPALSNPPGVDVRQPASTGAPVNAVEQTQGAPGQEKPGGNRPSGQAQGEPGGVGGRGLRSGSAPDISPTGRPSDVGPSPEGAELEGAEGGLPVPRPPGGRGGPRRGQPSDQALARNHVLSRDHDWVPTGDKTRVRANLEAVRLVKRLDAENRLPTPEEKEALTKYVGWGSVKSIFDEGNAYYRTLPEHRRPESYQNWEKQWGRLYDEVKAELTPEEWDSAAASILNAHYTSRQVVNAMWDAVERLGFRGGKALEPAAGIGHFIGLQPEASRVATSWAAVEMDDLSAKITSYLYPQARVQHSPFEKARIQPNSQDLVISNVPFLDIQTSGKVDDRYPPMALHNYFFARGLDLTKPGGMMVSITSDSTLDNGASKKARDLIAERADLVGAIRLPNIAFKENAGTEVTTDILFFRKKDGKAFDGEKFAITGEAKTYKGEPVTINEYYIAHPDMMLGRMSIEGTMHEAQRNALLPTNSYPALKGRAKLDTQLRDLQNELSTAIEKLPEDIFGATIAGELEPEVAYADTEAKEGTLFIQNSGVFKVINGELTRPEWAKNPDLIKQAKHYIPVRDLTRKQIALEKSTEATDEEIESSRKELLAAYKGYVNRYGPIGGKKSAFLSDDADFPLAAALEEKDTVLTDTTRKGERYVRQQGIWVPSAILKERVNFPDVIPTGADTLGDGTQISINYRGEVSPDYVAQLTGKPLAEVMQGLELSGLAFENPKTGIWEPRNEYLSGNVKQKLVEAQAAAEDDPRFQAHIKELQAVQPPPAPIERIGFQLGAKWLPPETVGQFVREVVGVNVEVKINPVNARWSITPSGHQSGQYEALNTSVLGMPHGNNFRGVPAHKLVELAMNLKKPVIKISYQDENGDTKTRKDVALSFQAEQRQRTLQDKFRTFVKASPELSQQVADVYNSQFTGSIDRQWEPPTWDYYPGASRVVALRVHQKTGVTRMLRENTLLAHGVGTGKTYIKVTWAMELKRLGLAHKTLIGTQNATTEQFARSARKLYPSARVLAPTEKERSATERNALMARIATGNWDIIIAPHSFIDLLPNDPLRERAYISERIDELKQAIIEAREREGRRSPTAADLQKAIKALKKKLDKIAVRKQDNVLYFEDLGIDAMAIDESHNYKKLDFTTLMDNIKGLDKSYTNKGFGLYMKTRYINEKRGTHNLVFGSGTPISNTLTESWNIMRHLRPDLLKQYGIEKFDEFAGVFTLPRTELEMTPTGNFKLETRLSRFNNEEALMTLWKSLADVQFAEDVIGEGLPSVKGGGPRMVMSEMTPEYRDFLNELQERLNEFAEMKGDERRENSWIPMWVQGQARKASVDVRMVKPDLPDQPNSKLNSIVREATRVYQESAPVNGTQAIFLDLFKSSPKDTRFNLHKELKRKLMRNGIPEHEILVVDGKLKGGRREAMFKAIDDGNIRIVIGTRKRIGEGVNYQEHNVAVLQGDAPWRPMDLEQSTGRGLRQRENKEINEMEILHFGVLGSFDSAMYGIISRKLKMINQVMKGIWPKGEEDPFDSVTMTFDHMMAELSGNPKAIEKVGLENDIRMLESAMDGHAAEVRKARQEIHSLSVEEPRTKTSEYRMMGGHQSFEDAYNGQIPKQERRIAKASQTAEEFAALFPPDAEPRIEMEGKIIPDHKEALKAIDKYMKSKITAAEKSAVEMDLKDDIETDPFSAIRLNGKDVMMKVQMKRKATVTETDDMGKPTKFALMFSDSHIVWHLKDADSIGANRATTSAGLLSGLRSQLQRIERQPAEDRGHLAKLQRDLKNLTEFVSTPFQQEAELAEKKAKLTALIEELGGTVKAESFVQGESVEWDSGTGPDASVIRGTFIRQEGPNAVVKPKEEDAFLLEDAEPGSEYRIPISGLRSMVPTTGGGSKIQTVSIADDIVDQESEDSEDND